MIRLLLVVLALWIVFMPESDVDMAIFWVLLAILAQLWKNGERG